MGEPKPAEIVQQRIKEHHAMVGSGHPWTGRGSEPQWNNPQIGESL